jgi:hypothetical protein
MRESRRWWNRERALFSGEPHGISELESERPERNLSLNRWTHSLPADSVSRRKRNSAARPLGEADDFPGPQVHLRPDALYDTVHCLLHRLFARVYLLRLPGESNRLGQTAAVSRFGGPRETVCGRGRNPSRKKPEPADNPQWLAIPARGLYTGIAVFGAIGSGKTSGCMYPFAEQILAYCATSEEKRIGGLILEVKGDFCYKVKDILEKHGRGDDYMEVSLESSFRYNPLYNDLDAYALAYGIASLLNNLFGRGKEPFWQQAYTNVVKFIILLHKVLYDYVTPFRRL